LPVAAGPVQAEVPQAFEQVWMEEQLALQHSRLQDLW
jgi:hypothetical protein